MSFVVVNDRAYLWEPGALLDASGNEVCELVHVLTPTGSAWRVTWRDGSTSVHLSETTAREAVEATIREHAPA